MRRYLTIKEKIEAQTYFEVWIYSHSIWLTHGDGNVKYEINQQDVEKAMDQALSIHLKSFPEGGGGELSYITKRRIVRLPDKEILEDMWDGSLGSFVYMKYWEPDIDTKELIKRIEEGEPDWFPYKAYYTEVIWELDLKEA